MMPIVATTALRPFRAQCLRQAARGLSTVRVRSPSVRVGLEPLVALEPQQKRQQSTRDAAKDAPPRPGAPKRVPDMTFLQFVRRVLGASLRNLVVALNPRTIRAAYRDSPFLIGSNVALLIFTFVFGAFALREYVKAFYNAEISKYPDPVANTLRRALYYTNVKPDPELALKYYKKAMEQCTEVGLDPFSDEVLGIRFQVSFWLEKINNHKTAIEVLESVLKDCKKWIGVMEQSVRDGKVDARGRYMAAAPAPPKSPVEGDAASSAPAPAGSQVEPETLWRKRQRLLVKAISTSVKLGELYSDEHVLDPDKSHAHLIWAVETSLNEFRRVKTDGYKPGEEAWLSPEELGGSIESLGRDYERKSQFHLAIPLFFQALRLCGSPCHRAVIMNNLSAAFAQHPIYSPVAGVQDLQGSLQELLDTTMPATRHECLDAALNWARNAYTHAQDVRDGDRTPECDEACAVALCNWGDVAAMLGKTDVARTKYIECIDVSRRMDFAQGVKQAQEGLAKLASTRPSQI